MKIIFLTLSAISLFGSVSEGFKEDGRCWDLICSDDRGDVPTGGFKDGIPCDCLDGECRRALRSDGDSELHMWTNNTQRNLESDNERKKTLRQLQNQKKKKKKRRTKAPTMPTTKAPTSGPPSGGASKLALGWRKWSCWQYETVRKDWCATAKGDNLEIQDCKKVRDKWTYNTDGAYVVIKHETLNKCWTTSGSKKLVLKPCDGSDAQKWDLDSSEKTHKHLGDLGDHLFEIQPASNQKGCITQNHHPKAGEKLSVQPCVTSRALGHQTNYWEKVN
jgi:hypothetical protein